MNSFEAFMMGDMNRGKTERVFDWDKALKILKEKKAKHAWAGLKEDMEWTAGTILEAGKLVTDSYTYLASTWATPVIVITENKYDECLYSDMIECRVYDTDPYYWKPTEGNAKRALITLRTMAKMRPDALIEAEA